MIWTTCTNCVVLLLSWIDYRLQLLLLISIIIDTLSFTCVQFKAFQTFQLEDNSSVKKEKSSAFIKQTKQKNR